LRAVLLITLLAAVPATAGGLSDLDAQNGFLNAQFGDRIEEHQGLVRVKDLGAIRLYVDSVDRKSFRTANLRGIAYLYYGDQLYAVVLAPRSARDQEVLLQVFREMYGEPYEGSSTPQWWGERVGLHWHPDPEGGPELAIFSDRRTVQRIEELGTGPFEILDRVR
jgi:hypothetical protein